MQAKRLSSKQRHNAEEREEGMKSRQKEVGTHLPSGVVVNNHSQDKSSHCPVLSLKTIHNSLLSRKQARE